MAPKSEKEQDPVSLDAERSRKFLRALAEHPFVTIIVTGEGDVTIYGKGLEADHVERIKEALTEIQQEG